MSDSKTRKRIKHARTATMVSGIMTLAGAVTLFRNQGQGEVSLYGVLILVDVVFTFSMAYGIYRKSRLCAVLMFEYFLLSKAFALSAEGHMNAGVFMIGLIFLYFMYQGIVGTFAYHKCKSCREGTPDPKPYTSILAGSICLILYVLVLPGLII